MLRAVVAYVAVLVPFAVLDMIWLSAMGARFYKPVLGDILLTQMRIAPAIAFYLIYPVGLVVFAVLPALRGGGIGGAMLAAALFGAIAYATYDLTNYTTLRNWTLAITLVDIAWGALLAAIAAGVGTWLTGWWLGST